MFDSTSIHSHVAAPGAKGGQRNAEKGYDAKANRDMARKRGILPVFPYRKNALRCEKTKRKFASFVALACGFVWIKSVHTA